MGKKTAKSAKPKAVARPKLTARAEDREARRRLYRKLPQQDWLELSDRKLKQLQEQAIRYQIPIATAPIDLYAAVQGLFATIAAFARGRHPKPAEDASDADVLMSSAFGGSPALERYRDEKARITKMQREELERSLVSVDSLVPMLGKVSGLIRDAGERLQTRFGPEAVEILNEAIDAADEEVGRFFGSRNDDEAGR